MTSDYLLQLTREALYLTLLVSAPAVLASFVVGLLSGLFQAVTQVQDTALSTIPKLVAVLASLALFGPWIGEEVARFGETLLEGIALIR